MELSVGGKLVFNVLLSFIIAVFVQTFGDLSEKAFGGIFICGLLGAYSYDIWKLHKQLKVLEDKLL